MTSNTNKDKADQGAASCTNGDNDFSGLAEHYSDMKRTVRSNSTRKVQVFADTDVDTPHNSKENAEAVAMETTEREEGKTPLNPWEEQDKPGQVYSSQINDKKKSNRTVQLFADTKVGRKQSNSKENRESFDESDAENKDNEEEFESVEREEKTERLDSLSVGETTGQLDSSTNNELHGTNERRSIDSQEINNQNEILGKIVTHSTFNRDSEAGINKDFRDGKDKNRCPLLNINRMSDISLSETQSDSTLTSDNPDPVGKTDANIERPVSGRLDSGICRGNLEAEKCFIENRGREENSSVLSRPVKTLSDVASKWLRVYVRDAILLVKDILKWTKIYSRNGLHLGQTKYQCRPLTQSKNSSLPEFPLPFNTANSLKPKTETVSNETETETLSTSNTSITCVDSLAGRCCEKIPDTLDFEFLQKMLNETQFKQGFLSHRDLPDSLDLIVIHVCDSNHFWGTVINSGVFVS